MGMAYIESRCLLFSVILLLLARGAKGMLHKHLSFDPPFLDVDHFGKRTVGFAWDMSGVTKVLKNFVRLTPDQQVSRLLREQAFHSVLVESLSPSINSSIYLLGEWTGYIAPLRCTRTVIRRKSRGSVSTTTLHDSEADMHPHSLKRTPRTFSLKYSIPPNLLLVQFDTSPPRQQHR